MYNPPKTEQEYWHLIDIHWNEIFHIMNVYLPTFQKQWIDGTSLDCPLGDFLVQLKKLHSRRLIRALNAVWFNLPDEKSVLGQPEGEIIDLIYDLCVREDQCLNDIGEF